MNEAAVKLRDAQNTRIPQVTSVGTDTHADAGSPSGAWKGVSL